MCGVSQNTTAKALMEEGRAAQHDSTSIWLPEEQGWLLSGGSVYSGLCWASVGGLFLYWTFLSLMCGCFGGRKEKKLILRKVSFPLLE